MILIAGIQSECMHRNKRKKQAKDRQQSNKMKEKSVSFFSNLARVIELI